MYENDDLNWNQHANFILIFTLSENLIIALLIRKRGKLKIIS